MLELDRIRGIEQGEEGPIFSRPVMNEARFTYFLWDVPVLTFVDLRDAFCFWVLFCRALQILQIGEFQHSGKIDAQTLRLGSYIPALR